MKVTSLRLLRALLTLSIFVLFGLSCTNSSVYVVSPNNSKNAQLRDGVAEPNTTPIGSGTVRYIFTEYQRRSVAATGSGGNENLVNTTTSAYTAFSDMAAGTDRASYTSGTTSIITDQDGNVWTLYTPSQATRDEFATKGYTVVKSIDWSNGPDQPQYPTRQKLRFTIN